MEYRFQNGENSKLIPVGNNPETVPPNDSLNNPNLPNIDPETGLPIELKQSKGDCSAEGIDVLPCLKCQNKMFVPEINLSEKSKKLLMVMQGACKVPRKSSAGQRSLDVKDRIFKYLNQGSENNYTETVMSASQQQLFTELENVNSKLFKKLFGGSWYQPPFSEDFETYFGISTQEAYSLLCNDTPIASFNLNSFLPLQSAYYMDCVFSNSSFACQEKPAYVLANKIRTQLHAVIKESLRNPIGPALPIATSRCYWEKVEGEYNTQFEEVLIGWANKGYKIGLHFENENPRCEVLQERVTELKGKLIAAAYVCEEQSP